MIKRISNFLSLFIQKFPIQIFYSSTKKFMTTILRQNELTFVQALILSNTLKISIFRSSNIEDSSIGDMSAVSKLEDVFQNIKIQVLPPKGQ